ncbi:hypothetical protein ABS764_04035 [Flavobacterium sp. ST-87]|uniref:Polysaccharide deacetylase n=1 Tax=Flavobacterium plantiphilum TaxID=3163297 RepID=A0ABW8XS38_9FLAO
MKKAISSAIVTLFLISGCQQRKNTVAEKEVSITENSTPAKQEPRLVANNAAAILAKKEVPVLCYHNIRDFSESAGEMTKTYTVKPANFAEQMKALADAGYHSILPDQLYDYLVYNKALPEKPVMILLTIPEQNNTVLAQPK